MIRNHPATSQIRAVNVPQETPEEGASPKPAPQTQAPFERVPSWYARPWGAEEKLRYGLNSDVKARRNEAGRKALNNPTENEEGLAAAAAAAPSYFRTYEQIKEKMLELQTRFPDLVTVDDIGDSGEKIRGEADRDIMRIRVTNKKSTHAEAEKPKLLWTGGYHAREIANPELLLRWLETVLENYGKDPEATALLDSRILDIVPMVNPDGHAQVERSYAGDGGYLMQRKNTTPPDGTDLNRNHTFKWGGPGASPWPSNDTYRGPSAASESEVRAVEALVAATDYTMTIDWHSYSELVLYPWGHTEEDAPDHEGLKAIAERFASFNGYTPQKGVDLYPTSGTSEGPGYGMKRIPAFTVETGTSFHQSDRQFARTKRETWPVMTYSAKIADKPYERAKGPDLARVRVNAQTGQLTATALTAVDSAIVLGLKAYNTMTKVEYVLDPLTPAGQGIPLTPVDGAMDNRSEQMSVNVAELIRTAMPGTLIHVRGCDSDGNWGPLTAQWLVPPATQNALKTAA